MTTLGVYLLFGLLLVLACGGVAWGFVLIRRQHSALCDKLSKVEATLAHSQVQLTKLSEQSAASTADLSQAALPIPPQAVPLPPGLPLGLDAPLFTLPDVYGVPQSISALRGHSLLLIFFNPASAFCRDLAPQLVALMSTRKGHDPFPILVSTGSLQANQSLVQTFQFAFPVLVQQALEVATLYRASGMPMGYHIDAKGRIASPLTVGAAALMELATHSPEAPVPEPAIPASGLAVGTPAPQFTLTDLTGKTRSLGDWLGRRVLLVFVDPYTEQNQSIGPHLARLSTLDATACGYELVLIGQSGASPNERAALDFDWRCPVLIQNQLKVSKAYGVKGSPAAYVIDPQGLIASPAAFGLQSVVSCAAAVQAEFMQMSGGLISPRPANIETPWAEVVCKVDEMPYGYAVRRVYGKYGVRFTQANEAWTLFRPRVNLVNPDALAALGDLRGKWIEAVPGTDILPTRRPLWRTLSASLGAAQAAQIMAESFMLNSDEDLKQLEASDPSEVFILKGMEQRRKGIRLATGLEAVKLKDEYLVAERFITDQYRYRDTTFHLRCYLLLILKDNMLSVWMYEDAICGWAKPSSKSATQFEEWVTHPDNAVPDDYPCSMTELCPALGLDFESTWRQIASKVKVLVSCCTSRVGAHPELKETICFQHFGFDVILKSNGDPSICEVNSVPEMDAFTPRFAALKDRVVRDGLFACGVVDAQGHGFRRV